MKFLAILPALILAGLAIYGASPSESQARDMRLIGTEAPRITH